MKWKIREQPRIKKRMKYWIFLFIYVGAIPTHTCHRNKDDIPAWRTPTPRIILAPRVHIDCFIRLFLMARDHSGSRPSEVILGPGRKATDTCDEMRFKALPLSTFQPLVIPNLLLHCDPIGCREGKKENKCRNKKKWRKERK